MGRVGGRFFFKVNDQQLMIRGTSKYNLGQPKREAVIGADSVHGFKETVQVPYIEVEATDSYALDLVKLLNVTDATITGKLANGKTVVFRKAWHAGDGDVETEEGKISLRFEAESAEENK